MKHVVIIGLTVAALAWWMLNKDSGQAGGPGGAGRNAALVGGGGMGAAPHMAEPAPPPPPPPPPPIEARLNGATIDTIRQLLIDTNPNVRIAAIDLLYHFNDSSIYEMVRGMLKSETDPAVLSKTFDMFGREKDEKAIPVLMAATKHYVPSVKVSAIENLSLFVDPQVIPPISAAMKDYNEEVKVAAMKAVETVQKALEEKRRKEEEERRRQEELAAQAEAQKKKGIW